jgi:hypothetical protein
MMRSDDVIMHACDASRRSVSTICFDKHENQVIKYIYVQKGAAPLCRSECINLNREENIMATKKKAAKAKAKKPAAKKKAAAKKKKK